MADVSNIYCISGLGADYRLFSKLQMEDYNFVCLPWVPSAPGDTMSSYAAKMFHSIPEENPIVLGLSFGGMLTTEMCKSQAVKHGIIISSAKTRAELGYGNPLFLWLSNRNILPDFCFRYPFRYALYRLGVQTADERKLLSQIMSEANPRFVKWSINTLLSWQNKEVPANLTHIHGTRDKVIASTRVRPHYWIENGSHIMIYNRAAEICALVRKIIEDAG